MKNKYEKSIEALKEAHKLFLEYYEEHESKAPLPPSYYIQNNHYEVLLEGMEKSFRVRSALKKVVTKRHSWRKFLGKAVNCTPNYKEIKPAVVVKGKGIQ